MCEATVYKYSLNVTKFYIYHCQRHKTTQQPSYKIVFSWLLTEMQEAEMSVSFKKCLKTINNETTFTGPQKLKLTSY